MSETPFGITDFHVELSYQETEVVLEVSGVLDMFSAPELEALFDAMFDRGHDAVVIDLAEVESVDGFGLRALTNAARRLRSFGALLTVRSPTAELRRILDLNGLLERAPSSASSTWSLGPAGAQHGATREVLAPGTDLGLSHAVDPVVVMAAEDQLLDDTLRLVVNLACQSVEGADGASVSLLRDGAITTVAASDQTVLSMDAGQYSTGQGPCLDASLGGRRFHVSSLECESRWPAFTPVARALGIQAILSNPLLIDDRPVGALNIYSRTLAPFGVAQQHLAASFAAEVSAILTSIGLGISADWRAKRLHAALRSREVIAQAQGVIMEREGVGEDLAFDQLRRLSQTSGLPLREHAEHLVTSTGAITAREQQIVGGDHL